MLVHNNYNNCKKENYKFKLSYIFILIFLTIKSTKKKVSLYFSLNLKKTMKTLNKIK